MAPGFSAATRPARPSDLDIVRAAIRSAGASRPIGPVHGLILPHGRDATARRLQVDALRSLPDELERLVVLGPSHDHPLPGLALPTHRRWETPLGELVVDRDAVGHLLALDEVVIDDRVHRQEWSLDEVLLVVAGLRDPVPVVPIVVGHTRPGAVADALDLLWDSTTGVLVSSDLSCHQRASDAVRIDRLTLDELVGTVPVAPGVGRACAVWALAGLVELVRRRGWRFSEIDTGVSEGGDPVTGYASVAVVSS